MALFMFTTHPFAPFNVCRCETHKSIITARKQALSLANSSRHAITIFRLHQEGQYLPTPLAPTKKSPRGPIPNYRTGMKGSP